jgi:hypothetical protein
MRISNKSGRARDVSSHVDTFSLELGSHLMSTSVNEVVVPCRSRVDSCGESLQTQKKEASATLTALNGCQAEPNDLRTERRSR